MLRGKVQVVLSGIWNSRLKGLNWTWLLATSWYQQTESRRQYCMFLSEYIKEEMIFCTLFFPNESRTKIHKREEEAKPFQPLQYPLHEQDRSHPQQQVLWALLPPSEANRPPKQSQGSVWRAHRFSAYKGKPPLPELLKTTGSESLSKRPYISRRQQQLQRSPRQQTKELKGVFNVCDVHVVRR